MKRRKFIEVSSWVSTSLWAPAFLKNAHFKTTRSRSGSNLVIIQLSGGNDGLNTVVPFTDDNYYRERPSLALDKESILPLTDLQGLNPALKSLKSQYDDGTLCILNGVGYPNPDRSHFRSMDIWHTGSGSDQTWSSGWLGRYLDSACSGCELPYHALEIGDDLTLALKGEDRRGFVLSNADMLDKTTRNRIIQTLASNPEPSSHTLTNYLYKTITQTVSSAEYLVEQTKTYNSPVQYPNSKFARDLKQVSQLITSDTDTKIYYVSLPGFDTHAQQLGPHTRLLTQYDEGVAAFIQDLKHHNLFDDTLIMTFSEFGRRVKENGSRGTDHGTANNVFMMNGNLNKPGTFNQPSDLVNLDQGDLIYAVDFRSIYAEILEDWLSADADLILDHSFNKLGFLS